MLSEDVLKTIIHETQSCLVLSIQEELSKQAALRIQTDLLERIHGHRLKGVVIDLSGVKVIDSILWDVFSKTSQMVKMLGAPCYLTGLNPGVVASIIDLNIDIREVNTARTLEDALATLNRSLPLDVAEEDEDGEPDDVPNHPEAKMDPLPVEDEGQ
jgi:rsbT antagonist protein RsbS